MDENDPAAQFVAELSKGDVGLKTASVKWSLFFKITFSTGTSGPTIGWVDYRWAPFEILSNTS